MTTTGEFVTDRMAKALAQIPELSKVQMAALLGDERDMEALPFRERDDLIMRGLAIRAWPTESNPFWRTWVTMSGLIVRAALSDGQKGAE